MKKITQLTLAALLLFSACNTDSRHGIPENCEDLDRTDVYEVANFAYLAMVDKDIEELMCLVDKENENIDLEERRESFVDSVEFFHELENYSYIDVELYGVPLSEAKGDLFRKYDLNSWTEKVRSYQVIFAEDVKNNQAYVIVLLEGENQELFLFSPFEFMDMNFYRNFKDYTPKQN